jgi:hypothetical protein
MIAVRESQFQFPFRGTIARFDRLLEQTQHRYCIAPSVQTTFPPALGV